MEGLLTWRYSGIRSVIIRRSITWVSRFFPSHFRNEIALFCQVSLARLPRDEKAAFSFFNYNVWAFHLMLHFEVERDKNLHSTKDMNSTSSFHYHRFTSSKWTETNRRCQRSCFGGTRKYRNFTTNLSSCFLWPDCRVFLESKWQFWYWKSSSRSPQSTGRVMQRVT